jgi:hypothetical protein
VRPTFIGIGVQKCATSWLHEVLQAHPDIYTTEPKEVDFFTAFFDRGYEWYGRCFAPGAAAQARGETSPSYFYHPDAPARVRAYDPDMRIIVIFRDPVARAFSNHLHEIRAGHFAASEDFEAGLRNNPCYVEQGRYATHFARWLDAFPRSQILPLIFEDMTLDPPAAVRQVYAFLGVDPAGAVGLTGRKSNESVAFRHRGLQAALQRGGRLLRRRGLGAPLERFKQTGPVRRIMALNKRDLRREVPPMSAETAARLRAEFSDEIRRLASMLGRETLPWSGFAGAASDAPMPEQEGPSAAGTRA